MQAPADLARFCEETYPRLLGALSLYCGDFDVAQELAQETVAIVCRDWHKVRKMQAPTAWTYRVGVNLANSFFRRKGAEHRARRRAEQIQTQRVVTSDGAQAVAVRQLVASLPRRQRTAMVLRFYSDFSISQIAELMDCSEGTVKSQISRGMAKLRQSTQSSEGKEIFNAV